MENKQYALPIAIVIAGAMFSAATLYSSKNYPAQSAGANQKNAPAALSALEESVLPQEGVVLPVSWGDLGAQLVRSGAIDAEQFKTLYDQQGGFTAEYQTLLSGQSSGKLKITPENAGYLLNLFWALGLASNNPILSDSKEMENPAYGGAQNFASTGGWTLGTKEATELYSNFEITKLTPDQQKILEDFAYNSYRPCCSNPTGFPDCNHGMAALALGEIMAAQGASAEEIFEAFKYLNAFWFPQTYFDVAKYFQAKEGKDWSQVDARTVAGKDYSTPQGWDQVISWLKINDLVEEVPSGGGSCGV